MNGTVQLTDDLVAAAAGGSPAETSRVMEAIAPQVQLMVIARLNPSPGQLTVVDDLTQVSLAALMQGLPRLQNATALGLRAFLSTIVSRKVADHLRSVGRDAPAEVPGARSLDSSIAERSDAGPLWQFLSASGPSPGTAAARQEMHRVVLAALARLPERSRRAITMAFFDQLPTREIARQLDISRPAASMLLLRAIGDLRDRVREKGVRNDA